MKSTTLLLTLILSFTVGSLSSSAQTIISGVVTDPQGQPLPSANVYFEGTYTGTSTDLNGKFHLSSEESGKIKLRVDYLGYESFVKPIELNGQNIELQVTLQEAFNRLKAVSVSAGRYGTGDVKKAAVLKPLDIVTTASALGDIGGAFQVLPGTTVNPQSGRLFVRGGRSQETGTYINGLLVQSPYLPNAPNNPSRGRFNPFMFSGVALNMGAYSAEYGQALSSVLLLETKDVEVQDQLNLSLMSVGLGATGTKTTDDASLAVGIDYINLSPYFSIVPQNISWEKAPSSLSSHLHYKQKFSDAHTLKVYGQLDVLKLQQASVEGSQDAFALNNSNLYLNASLKSSIKDWVLYSGLSFSRSSLTVIQEGSEFETRQPGQHLKLKAVRFPSERLRIMIGAEILNSKPLRGVDAMEESLSKKNASTFVQSDYHFSKNLVAQAGLRVERSFLINETFVNPRIALAYQVKENHSFSLAYGEFNQDPQVSQLFDHADLGSSKAIHFVGSYSYQKDDRLLKVEAYNKDYKKLPLYASEPFGRLHSNNQGSGMAQGLDVFFKDNKSIKNLEFWLSYSYLNAKRLEEHASELSMPTFASSHKGAIVLKAWVSELRSLIGASFQISSGRPYDDPSTIQFNDKRLPSYKTLDFNWSYLHRQNVIIYTSVSNVLGFENVFGYNYKDDKDGNLSPTAILPNAKRMFFIGMFITLSKKNEINQLETLN